MDRKVRHRELFSHSLSLATPSLHALTRVSILIALYANAPTDDRLLHRRAAVETNHCYSTGATIIKPLSSRRESLSHAAASIGRRYRRPSVCTN